MKDSITLHPEHGLNPSIEVCMICGEEMGIALLGNNIKGQAPHHRGDDAACRCVCAGPGSILGISQTIKQKSYENI